MKPISKEFSFMNMEDGSKNEPLNFSFQDDRKTKKSTPSTARVSVEELELTYLNNSLIFNSINKIIQTMFSYGEFKIESEDKEAEKFLKEFTEQIGKVGELLSWDELLEEISLNSIKFGKSFVENIKNKKGNRIVDWDLIDTSTIVYARDSNDNIVLKEGIKPLGYFQVLPDTYAGDLSEQDIPEEVTSPKTASKYIYLDSERVAQIKLYKTGDGFFPMGLIESVYRDNVRKLGIKEMIANSADWHGFPIVVQYLGNDRYQPTSDHIKTAAKNLKDLRYNKQVAMPHFYRLELLESSGDSFKNSGELLKLYEEEEVSGMGVPRSIAKNTGDGSGSVVMNQAIMSFHLMIRDIAKRIANSIRKEMFKPLMESHGYKSIPKLNYYFISPYESETKARRLLKFVQAGVIEPDEEIKEKIKKLELI